jgi:hypothetical protein
MRKATVVLVAAMILLAGCSGGGGTATPTDTETDTENGGMDGTTTPGMNDGTADQPNVSEALQSLNTSDSDLFADATAIEMTLYNGSQQTEVLIQNDSATNTELIRFSTPQSGTLTYYNTTDYAALRNTSSGEVQYGAPGGNLGFGVGFGAALTLFAGLSYVSFVEWEQGGTTTVNGETAFVYEGDSLNQSALSSGDSQGFNPNFDQGSVDSVDGEMIINSDGQLQSINIDIRRSGERFGVDFSVNYDSVTIQTPDWVDESEAESQAQTQ